GARERRIPIAAERDQRQHESAAGGKERDDLARLAAVGHGEEYVTAHERAEVAMAALAGVEEEGRRPGRGERRGDLPADDARLTDARDDHLATTGEQQLER